MGSSINVNSQTVNSQNVNSQTFNSWNVNSRNVNSQNIKISTPKILYFDKIRCICYFITCQTASETRTFDQHQAHFYILCVVHGMMLCKSWRWTIWMISRPIIWLDIGKTTVITTTLVVLSFNESHKSHCLKSWHNWLKRISIKALPPFQTF